MKVPSVALSHHVNDSDTLADLSIVIKMYQSKACTKSGGAR